jgi:hypothetical protein
MYWYVWYKIKIINKSRVTLGNSYTVLFARLLATSQYAAENPETRHHEKVSSVCKQMIRWIQSTNLLMCATHAILLIKINRN